MTQKPPFKAFQLIQGNPNSSDSEQQRAGVPFELANLIEDVRLRWLDQIQPVVTTKHQQTLLENPEWVFELLWDTVRHYEHETPSKPYQIRLFLLGHTLFCMGVNLEHQPGWVHELSASIQREIAQHILTPDYPHGLHVDIVDVVLRSQLPIDSELKAANIKVSHQAQLGMSQEDPIPLGTIIRDLENKGFGNPFTVAKMLMKQMVGLDLERQIDLVSFMAADDHPVVLDTLGMMLLHPETRIRRLTPELLRDLISLKRMSSATLRRMIVIRNWLPQREKVVLDRLIREAKRALVTCEPLQPCEVAASFASCPDGRGEMAIWTKICRNGSWFGCRIILSMSEGIVSVDTRPLKDPGDMDEELAMIRRNMVLLPIAPTFFEMAVEHALAVGLAKGQLPKHTFLQVTEWMGWSAVAPNRIDSEEALAHLLAALPEGYRRPRQIQRILNVSSCKRFETITKGWYLQGEAVQKSLLSMMGGPSRWEKDPNAVLAMICRDLLEPKRAMWVERLVWVALWLKHAGPRGRVMWKHMTIIADTLARGAAVAEIPLFVGVAQRTLISLHAQARQLAAKGRPVVAKMALGE